MAPPGTTLTDPASTIETKSKHKHRRHHSTPSRQAITTTPRASADTLTIKLRNTLVSPPQTRTYSLPLARAIATSAYLRTHTSVPPPRAKDGIVRLNFPDFEIFEIYAEWLQTGTVLTKAALREGGEQVGDSAVDGTEAMRREGNERRKTGGEDDINGGRNAKQAYQDYLGAYFLSTWLQDTVFKDTLVSLIIDTINSDDTGRESRGLLRALTPTLINLALTDAGETRGLRCLIYAAIAKWGTVADFARFVPDEGETCERGFVRGLLAFLAAASREPEQERSKRSNMTAEKKKGGHPMRQAHGERKGGAKDGSGFDGHMDEEGKWGQPTSTPSPHETPDTANAASTWTPLSLSPAPAGSPGLLTKPPPPWQPSAPREIWTTASHVSWPSTSLRANPSEAASPTSAGWVSAASRFHSPVAPRGTTHEGRKNREDRAEEEAAYAGWPVAEEEHCLLHEHDRLGMKCHRKEILKMV